MIVNNEESQNLNKAADLHFYHKYFGIYIAVIIIYNYKIIVSICYLYILNIYIMSMKNKTIQCYTNTVVSMFII